MDDSPRRSSTSPITMNTSEIGMMDEALERDTIGMSFFDPLDDQETLRESHRLIFRCNVLSNALEQLVGLDLEQDNVGFLDTMLSLQDDASLSPSSVNDANAMPPPGSSQIDNSANTREDDSKRVERQNGSSSSNSHVGITPINHHGSPANPGGDQRQPQKKKQAPPGAWATPPNPSYHSTNNLLKSSQNRGSGGGGDSTLDQAEFLRKTTSMPDFSGFGLLPGGGPGAAAFAGFASRPSAHGGNSTLRVGNSNYSGGRGCAGGNPSLVGGRNMSHGDLTAAIWGTPLPGSVPREADTALGRSSSDGLSISGKAPLGGEERASSHHGRQTSSASTLPSSDGYSDGGSGEDGRAPRKQRTTREPRSVSSSNSWPDLSRINMAASPHLPERTVPSPVAAAGTCASSGSVAAESATMEPPLLPQPSSGGGLRLAGGGGSHSSAVAPMTSGSNSFGSMAVPQLGRFVLSTPSSTSALASSSSSSSGPYLAPATSSSSGTSLAASSALRVPSWPPVASSHQEAFMQPGPTGNLQSSSNSGSGGQGSLRRGAKSSGSMTGGRNKNSSSSGSGSHGCLAGSSSSFLDPSAQRAAVDEERRNRRLARNRASARLRRQRKKGLVESFEADVALLELTLQQLQRHRWGTSGLHARSSPPPSCNSSSSGVPGQTTATTITSTPMGPPSYGVIGGGGNGAPFQHSPFVDLGAALAELQLSGAAADRAEADHSPVDAGGAAGGGESDRARIGARNGGGGGSSSCRSSDLMWSGTRSRGAASASLRARQESVHCTRGHLIEAMTLPELLKAAAAARGAGGASGSGSGVGGARNSSAAASDSHAHDAAMSPSSSSSSGNGVESSSSSSANTSTVVSSSADALAGMGEELVGLLHLSQEQQDQLLDLSTASAARASSAAAGSSKSSSYPQASSRSRRGTETGGVVATVADDVLELAVLNKCLEALRGPRWQETPTLESLQTAWQELLTAPQQRAFASWLRSNQDQVASLDLSVKGACHFTEHPRVPAFPRFVFEQRDGGGSGGSGAGGYDDDDLEDRDSDSLSHQQSSSNSLSTGHYHSSSNSLPGAGHALP